MYKVMTPGPTQVKENVRMARSLVCTNPDLDEDFVEFYKDTCELISSLLGTKNETLILDGEGILGLEAACDSLTEPVRWCAGILSCRPPECHRPGCSFFLFKGAS